MLPKFLLLAFCLFFKDLLFDRPWPEPAIPVTTIQPKTLHGALDSSLTKYYKYVNLAAKAIYKNDFSSAITCYDSAFLYKANPNYVDVKNYILLNSKYCLFSNNDAYIRMLFTTKLIDSTLLFTVFPKRVFSAQNLISINKLQSKIYKTRPTDNALQKAMQDLFVLYEEAINNEAFEKPGPDSSKTAYRTKKTIHQQNAETFLRVYAREGFPTEEKVGVFYAPGEEWATRIDLLLQQFLRTDKKEPILAILHAELQRGNLHPARYAALLDYARDNSKRPDQTHNLLNTTVILVNGEAYRPFVYYSDSLMQLVNTNRLRIGLDSFHITQKQVICQHFCRYATADSSSIAMAAYPKIDVYSYGVVKWAFEKEKQDLAAYKINTRKILQECKCVEKSY